MQKTDLSVVDRFHGLHGHTCIYKERRFIQVVRLTEVRFDEEGLSISFQRVPERGFADEERQVFSMEGSWEIVSVSHNFSVSMAWIGNLLITRPESVDLIRQAATELGSRDKESLSHLVRLINRLR